MKRQLLTLSLLAAGAISALGATDNHPDSVYVKATNPNPGSGVQLSYSADRKTWIPIGHDYNVFKSDYGAWGAQKKMYNPAISYDGKKFYAEFIPDPKVYEIARTESDNLFVWKPQDYPKVSKAEFEAKQEQLKKAENIIKVPYAIVENLIARVAQSELNGQRDNESMNVGGFADNVSGLTTSIKIDLNDRKAISPELMGIFFEDINYAADGGLYAEMVQNRDFEYGPDDHNGWQPHAGWVKNGEGFDWGISTKDPIHPNNPHYSTMKVTTPGGKLVNNGWEGYVVKAKEKYNLSLFLRGNVGKVKVSIITESGTELASATVSVQKDWKQMKAVLTPSASDNKARLAIEPLAAGDVDIDFVSLFPQNTYKQRPNGMRPDLAQTLADLKPKFVRFPGGCASHGQGIDNIYHWQTTVGDLWERKPDFNIWGYHQSKGIGFYEYFQFCEDIGATALPVLAAGVPCQNSAKGGNGQNGGIPFEADLKGQPSPYKYMGKDLTMESYLQELLDLIEWANGDPKTSKLAQIRAKAGHPKPFGMKYLGIGNEDLLGDVFNVRFTYLYEGIKKAHPEITVIGTVGPFWEGSDYEYGWKEAKRQNIPIVDEHYYNNIGWYLNHQDFYDKYDRNGTKVYLGEWASRGNLLENALAEAIHFTNVERNADVVVMSSYAPLLAKEGHTQWNPDLIYFNNNDIKPTPNYYVQRMVGQNVGDEYVYSTLEFDYTQKGDRKTYNSDIAKRLKTSVVEDKETGDIIIKIVNALPIANTVSIDLGDKITFNDKQKGAYRTTAQVETLTDKNLRARNVSTTTSQLTVGNSFTFDAPQNSFSVIRIRK